MPQLHLITGHRRIDRGDAPVVIYCGHDADAAMQALTTALASGSVALADQSSPNNRVTRYADPAAVASYQPPAPPASMAELIKIVLSEKEGGEGPVVIVVGKESEELVRDLLSVCRAASEAVKAAEARGGDLEKSIRMLTEANERLSKELGALKAPAPRPDGLDTQATDAPAAPSETPSPGPARSKR